MCEKMSRREFLYASALAAVGSALVACAAPDSDGGAAEVPTQVPATAAPAEGPTPIPTRQAQPTAVPTMAPEAVAKEAPMLQELVEKGELPPLDERLPTNPLVLSPIDEIGAYGGVIRTFSNNLGNHWEECQYGNSPLRWVDDGLAIAPGHCESWSTNEDNSEWTVKFRKGLRWSDGEPCTVDDVLFWWEDLVLNPNHSDNPPDFGSAGGELVQMIKVDDHTLTLKYIEPAPLTGKRLAMWVNSDIGPRWIAPKHYLTQFHPSYDEEVTDFDDFDQKILFRQNPDCPTLTSWMCERYEASVSRTWVRNPYYYAVDTEGNQLPYIDRIEETMVEDSEVQKLTIMQGGIDFVHFHRATLADVGTLKDSEDEGGYEVRLWDSGSGTGMMYFWNYDYPDEKKRALYRTAEFKRAMSYAIDREKIQKVVYYNTGWPTTGTMSPKAIEYNFSEEARALYQKARDAYVEYDPEKAMAMLDEIGIQDADGDGWREYPDGEDLEVRIDLPSDAGNECMNTLEIVSDNWRAIGLNVIINQVAPADFENMWKSGQGDIHSNWEVGDGPDHLVYPSWMVPNEPARWAPLCGRRLELLGTVQAEQEQEKDPWDRQPARFNSDERDLIGEPVWRLQEIYEEAKIEPDEAKRHSMVWEMINLHIEQGPFFVGTVCNYPRIIFVSKQLTNVPTKDQLATGGFVNPWIIPFPAITNPETYAFK